MINKLKNIVFFAPVLYYPPFQFTYTAPVWVRVSAIITLIFFLFIGTKRFIKKDLIFISLILAIYVSFIAVNKGSLEGIVTSSSIVLTYVFAYSLSRVVEMNIKVKKKVIDFYMLSFSIIPLCSVLSIIYYMMLGQFHLFNPYTEAYNYLYTPFGVLLPKNMFGFNIYRSFFYFIEPVFLSFFYAVNIFYIPREVNDKYNYFKLANIIGGILTFSYLFYVLIIVLLFIKSKSISFSFFQKIILVILLVLVSQFIDFLAFSSASDRLYRIGLFFSVIKDTTALQFMFGRGFYSYYGFDKNFSAGLFTNIYEMGVINFVFIMVFFYYLSNRRKYMFVLFFIAMLTFDPIKLPFFWVLMVLLSNVYFEKNDQTLINNNINKWGKYLLQKPVANYKYISS